MQYKRFGKTDKNLSVLGFGGMRFLPEEYKSGSLDKCVELMVRAQELGINYFDTAPTYCDDYSIKIFGEAFKQMKKGFYVGSKTSTHVTGDKTADDVLRRIESNIKSLGVDKIDFYYLWCILDYGMFETYTKKGGIFDGFLKAKELGLIEHINLSTHASGEDIDKMLRTGLFEGVLLGYNAINFAFREKGLAAAKELNLGVLTMNPLGGGIIPQNPDKFSFLKENDEQSVAAAALRFNASHDEINVVLNGISSMAQLEEGVAAMDNISVLTKERKDYIRARLNEDHNKVCTGCGYCDDCPQGIPIPKFMDCYNQYLLSGKESGIIDKAFGFWQFGSEWENIKTCIECGQCEGICTQKLPIIQRLKKIDQAIENVRANS